MAVPVRHLVAVTACVSGVAHTYMAAERLENFASRRSGASRLKPKGHSVQRTA